MVDGRMKKLLLLLFSLLLSFNSYGEWIYIDKEKNSDAEIYVQTESIEVDEEGDEFRIKSETDNQLNYAIKLLNG